MNRSKIIPFFIAVLFTCIILLSCNSRSTQSYVSKKRGIWDTESKIYIDKGRNIQWDLSNIDNWRIAEEYRLPENMQFTAVADDYGICVSLLTIPIDKDEKITSMWTDPEEFINGIQNSIASQALSLPGITYQEPMFEKVHYLFKEALKVTLKCHISDARLLNDTSIPFVLQIYAFILDNECIEVMAMVPQWIIDEYGEESFDDVINRFGYIDASKEAQK